MARNALFVLIVTSAFCVLHPFFYWIIDNFFIEKEIEKIEISIEKDVEDQEDHATSLLKKKLHGMKEAYHILQHGDHSE